MPASPLSASRPTAILLDKVAIGTNTHDLAELRERHLRETLCFRSRHPLIRAFIDKALVDFIRAGREELT